MPQARTRRGRQAPIVLALPIVLFAGCGVAKTTYRTTRFVARSTVAATRAGVKLATWPFRAMSGDHGGEATELANRYSKPTGPEPVILGASDLETSPPTSVASGEADDPETRTIAYDPDDTSEFR